MGREPSRHQLTVNGMAADQVSGDNLKWGRQVGGTDPPAVGYDIFLNGLGGV
ncbi:hypothetical protein GCM10022408_23530 [Hymenobacter fastidiosus]|uniref:Uncharacterized protein n=1 Tax=Hymenobacter fastidiosus TaxID=486264 RepID=A0ABP7SEJ1_9BACT